MNHILRIPFLLAASLLLMLASCGKKPDSEAQPSTTPPAASVPDKSEPTAPPPVAAAQSATPSTSNEDVAVSVLGVKSFPGQGIEIGKGKSARRQLAEPGSILVCVKLGITPKKASEWKVAAGMSKLDSIAKMVQNEGDYVFISPFARLQTEASEEGGTSDLAIIDDYSKVISGDGKASTLGGFDDITAPIKGGGVATFKSLAVGKESVITLGFFVPKEAKKATLRIEGCADMEIGLEDRGEW